MKQITRHNVRRGNALILVAGILVLLVIVATAFITRTQGSRVTSTAVQQAATRDTKAEVIAEGLAQELADALFVRPLPPGTTVTQTVSSDLPRLPVEAAADVGIPPRRYNVDLNFTYNFAPYATVPWTNPPDEDPNDPTTFGFWPKGPGAPNGLEHILSSGLLVAEGNPYGNPGYGDSRWLADTEPFRIDSGPISNGFHDALAYWRHMSYIATPENGFRLVRDISDVLDSNSDGVGGLLLDLDLNIPVEQFLASVQHDYPHVAGDIVLPVDDPAVMESEFIAPWQNWFSAGYRTAYVESAAIPPNRINLTNLDGFLDGDLPEHPSDDHPVDWYEEPAGQFIRGSARWFVNRVLADADGDGYTDSFWMLAPTVIDHGIRQLVAVRVVDNSSMLNVNTATRFIPAPAGIQPTTTAGETPADVALVGQQDDSVQFGGSDERTWNVGYFDMPLNWEDHFDNAYALLYGGMYDGTVRWDSNNWPNLLLELGAITDVADAPFAFVGREARRRYWLTVGSRPFDRLGSTAPFSLDDELELRMFSGQNHPWIFSRFENAMSDINDPDHALVRALPQFEELSPYLDQLNTTELLHDHRRKLTMVSGARNETLPPWLWWDQWWLNDAWESGQPTATVLDVINTRIRTLAADIASASGQPPDEVLLQLREFVATTKIDLRQQMPVVDAIPPAGGPCYDCLGVAPANDGPQHLPVYLHEWLPYAILNAISEVRIDPLGGTPAVIDQGYYRIDGPDDLERLSRMAAGLTANILASRDPDRTPTCLEYPEGIRLPAAPFDPLVECFAQDGSPRGQVGAIPLPDVSELPLMQAAPVDEEIRMLGMEPQPFLMEVFVGHVHETFVVPDCWTDAGDRLVLWPEGGCIIECPVGSPVALPEQSTVVAVQIANPYDQPILLFHPDPTHYVPEYELEVLDETISLNEIAQSVWVQRGSPSDTGVELPPAREDYPITWVLYSIDDDLGAEFKTNWIDFLDLKDDDLLDPGDHPVESEMIDLQALGFGLSTDREDYGVGVGAEGGGIRLRRDDIVIDRLDSPSEDRFTDALEDLPEPLRCSDLNTTISLPAQEMYDSFDKEWRVPDADDEHQEHWVTFVRATRAWGWDRNFDGLVDPTERNPRFIVASTRLTRASELTPMCAFDPRLPEHREYEVDGDGQPMDDPRICSGNFQERYFPLEEVMYPDGNHEFFGHGVLFNFTTDPEDETIPCSTPWFTLDYPNQRGMLENRKPTFFDMNPTEDPDCASSWSWWGDKGFYHSNFPLQMTHKDADFQQVGEILNVFLWAHEVEVIRDLSGQIIDHRTAQTFSEFLDDEPSDGDELFRGRLQLGHLIGNTQEGAPFDADNPRHAVPDLPAGVRLLDLFVCDGPGYRPPDGPVPEETRFGNAVGFSGEPTHGLINVNTAPVEVLRALPHWYKLVHQQVDNPQVLASLPRSAIAESLISYRERFHNNLVLYPDAPGFASGPAYDDRGDGRGDRGLASIGEILLLDEDGTGNFPPGAPAFTQLWREFWLDPAAWSRSFAAKNPFSVLLSGGATRFGAFLSTDVNNPTDAAGDPIYHDFEGDGIIEGDFVAGDAEEANMLFAGASNLITTRSDFFTVYFKIRSFRQNPTTGIWDATDPEYIVDDSRYVMLVDRSAVNRPGDKPRILYLQKLPN